MRFIDRYDDGLAHRIYAGADLYLMPSAFEPCGLSQMIAMRYGTPPVVHSVGGLADSVEDFDPDSGAGTGFTFSQQTTDALTATVRRALRAFHGPRTWDRIMHNSLTADFGFTRCARSYAGLYAQL